MSKISNKNNPIPKTKAYINGNIFTVNDKQRFGEAVITLGNKIIFVGSNEEVKSFINKNTETIDLNGKLMLPGFNDAHTHFIHGGFHLNGLNLRPAKSVEEFREKLKNYVEENPGKWITGGDWNHEIWDEKILPNKEMIDSFSKGTPIFIKRIDGHMGLANSLALKSAGITKDTPNPPGGTIERNLQTGEPTGILKDSAMNLVYSIVPEPSENDYYKAAISALEEAKRNGITSIQDITLPNDLKTFQSLEKENKLSCRIYTRLPIASYKKLIDEGIQYNFGNDKLRIGSLKAFADGSLGSGTAWFFENYKNDKTNFGLPMDIVTDGRLEKWALDADKNKLQISTHAIGDRANAYLLDLYEKIKEINPNWDRRFRIEHAQHVRNQDINKFAELGVIVSAQPYHLTDDGNWAAERLGNERINEIFQFKTFLGNNVKVCFGSDWTVAPLNALLGIYAAVTRQTTNNQNPNGWIPEQKISVEDAVKCYTINSAYAEFSEDKKGSIEPGKLADMVVLSDDIFTIEPERIKDVKVDMTVFDGEIIYQRNE